MSQHVGVSINTSGCAALQKLAGRASAVQQRPAADNCTINRLLLSLMRAWISLITPPMMLPPFFSRSYTCGRGGPSSGAQSVDGGASAPPLFFPALGHHIPEGEGRRNFVFGCDRLCTVLSSGGSGLIIACI